MHGRDAEIAGLKQQLRMTEAISDLLADLSDVGRDQVIQQALTTTLHPMRASNVVLYLREDESLVPRHWAVPEPFPIVAMHAQEVIAHSKAELAQGPFPYLDAQALVAIPVAIAGLPVGLLVCIRREDEAFSLEE